MVRIGSGISAFRSLPKVKGKRPAVIFLHERYGVQQHTKDLTFKLAQAGYVGLAPDLLSRFTGDRKALERGEARVELRDDEVVNDLSESIDYLKSLQAVDASRIGVVGVCQTGRSSLLCAAHRRDVSTCVVIYGAVGTREWETNELGPQSISSLVERLTCPLLGIFGEADHIISVDDVLRFRGLLEQYEKTYHIRLYRDAPHGWLNDTMPGRYRKEAAQDAWRLLLEFLGKTLKGQLDGDRVYSTFESDVSTNYDYKKNVRLE
ncbi:MAG: dienelactone hydrolase family protein [Candidatus Binatia bacterium]